MAMTIRERVVVGIWGAVLILVGAWAGKREKGLVPVLQAQEGQNVNISQGPPVIPYQKLFFYTAGGYMEYVCMAIGPSKNDTTFSITGATSATPAVFTAAGYGLYTADALTRSKVTVSGAAAPWTGVNGSWLVSPVNSTTFQLLSPTTGTAFDGGALGAWSGTATAATNAPRTNIGMWAIQRFTYDGTNKMTSVMWANTGSMTRNKCDDRAAAYTEYR